MTSVMTTAENATDAHPAAMRLRRTQMLAAYAASLGVESLRPCTIRLAGRDVVQVDGATPDESLIVEVDAHADPAAEGLRARIGQALLTLSLVRRERPEATFVLLVHNDGVRRAVASWVPALAGSAPLRVSTPQG